MYMHIFICFHAVLSESRKVGTLNTSLPKTDFNVKWPFKVIQGHVSRGHWKAKEVLNIISKSNLDLILKASEDNKRPKSLKIAFSMQLSFDVPFSQEPARISA